HAVAQRVEECDQDHRHEHVHGGRLGQVGQGDVVEIGEKAAVDERDHARHDDLTVERLRAAGALIVGHTGMPVTSARRSALSSSSSICAPLHQAEQVNVDQTLLPAWKSLSEAEGKRAWAEGSAMSIESIIEYSLSEPGSAISG
ncbi:hypothetical protein B4Q13_21760, partial [Lacticaseibacillus rhamnosus]